MAARETMKKAAIESGAEILEEGTPTLDEIFMARARTTIVNT